MKAFLLIGTMLVLALVAVFIILKVVPLVPQKEPETQQTAAAFAPYFAEQLVTLGIEDVGQPIEGFDADLLSAAYPALVASDFSGVAAAGGAYAVVDDQRTFVRDESKPMTSAERTVTEEGYVTMLANLSARLGQEINSTADVDTLIAAIDTNVQMGVGIGGTQEAFGVRITPTEVLEDSRCPIDVECVQEGTIRVLATLEGGAGSAPQEFSLGEPITTEAEIITLAGVTPVPQSDTTIASEEYRFFFEIQQR